MILSAVWYGCEFGLSHWGKIIY